MEQLARAEQWISSLNAPTSATDSMPNSSSNSQSQSASICAQSPVDPPPYLSTVDYPSGADLLYAQRHAIMREQLPAMIPQQAPGGSEYNQLQANNSNQLPLYNGSQTVYGQFNSAYDYNVCNHQINYHNHQQLLPAQQSADALPTSSVSSLFYDNAAPPYPYQPQVHYPLCECPHYTPAPATCTYITLLYHREWLFAEIQTACTNVRAMLQGASPAV